MIENMKMTQNKTFHAYLGGIGSRQYEGKTAEVGDRMNVVKDVKFSGRILDQVKDATAFVKTQIREYTKLGEGAVFQTTPEFPEFCWTELIVNAIAHRDYSIGGTDIQIKMFDDHLTVESPGLLPGLVRVNNIREFHFSRNPKIVELLNEYDLVKEFGEGVDRVYRDMAAAGLPEPEYRQSEFMLYATLKNKNWGKEYSAWNDDIHRLFEKGDEKKMKKEDEIKERVEVALKLVATDPKITVSELASAMNVTRKQAENALKRLKDDGRIHREGSARKGKWIID